MLASRVMNLIPSSIVMADVTADMPAVADVAMHNTLRQAHRGGYTEYYIARLSGILTSR